jgi:Sigma-70, region 4
MLVRPRVAWILSTAAESWPLCGSRILIPCPVTLAHTELGGRRVPPVEEWAEIRRLHRVEGLPIKVIARVMGVSRNTVRSAIASTAPPRYERARTGSIVDEVEPRIRELLQVFATMPATVIAERIGWSRSIRLEWSSGGAAAGVSAARPG